MMRTGAPHGVLPSVMPPARVVISLCSGSIRKLRLQVLMYKMDILYVTLIGNDDKERISEQNMSAYWTGFRLNVMGSISHLTGQD